MRRPGWPIRTVVAERLAAASAQSLTGFNSGAMQAIETRRGTFVFMLGDLLAPIGPVSIAADQVAVPIDAAGWRVRRGAVGAVHASNGRWLTVARPTGKLNGD
jgi:hypothetical protein